MIKRYIRAHPIAKLAIFVISLAAMYAMFYWFYGNHLSASMLVGSVALHELGHLVAYRYYGYTGGVVFLPPIGAVMIPSDQDAMKKMPEWRKAVTAFAGPGVNIALAVVGLVMATDADLRNLGLMMAALNGVLAAFNLLPFRLLDGGHIASALFESADEPGDRRILQVVTTSMWMCFAAIVLFGSFSVMPALFIWRLYKAAEEDDPEGWRKPGVMSRREIHQFTGIYAAAGASTLFIAALFQYWNSYR
ncbi:M50 family metallopeptidase [bacterium]|nr:M50 family metallopeptidase [bacterium]